jgi:hypothetical protein
VDKAAAAAAGAAEHARINQTAGRDQTLGTFHALGKLLHHKRDPEQELKRKVLGSLEAPGSTAAAMIAGGAAAAAGGGGGAVAGVAEALEAAEAALKGGVWKSEGQPCKQAKHSSNGIHSSHKRGDYTSSPSSKVQGSDSPSNGNPSSNGGSSSSNGDICYPVKLDVLPHLCRGPLKFDPDTVLAAGGLDAGSVVGFLSENYLTFTGEDEMEEVALAAEYLSIGGGWGCSSVQRQGRRWGWRGPGGIPPSGVEHGNVLPLYGGDG